MTRYRLDKLVHMRGLTASRSQAENYIRLAQVSVSGRVVVDPESFVPEDATITFQDTTHYVSRAALKLASVAKDLELDFDHKTVLDVGSSTGGFTDYALQHGASKVIAVDVGTDQLHARLRSDSRIELHEKTDILDMHTLSSIPDMVLIDVSFVSLRKLLNHIATLCDGHTQLVAMVKPQFEAETVDLKHKGIIKNDKMRRDILRAFEAWVKQYFIIQGKADSEVAGTKGNLERFYCLSKLAADARV